VFMRTAGIPALLSLHAGSMVSGSLSTRAKPRHSSTAADLAFEDTDNNRSRGEQWEAAYPPNGLKEPKGVASSPIKSLFVMHKLQKYVRFATNCSTMH